MEDIKIAVTFRGITRSLANTLPSIQETIITPAREFGQIKLFTHLFNQASIHNPRTNEFGQLDGQEHKLLASDELALDDPDECLLEYDFERFKVYGDPWKDDFNSLRNQIRELYSLKKVWEMAAKWEPDIFMFMRPDMRYHQSFANIIHQINRKRRSEIYIPAWSGWNGFNDSFYICYGKDTARIVGSRIDLAHEYCQRKKTNLHGEKFLLDIIQNHRIKINFIPHRATRVRFQGKEVIENFRILRKSNLPSFIVWMKNFFANLSI